MSSHWYTKDGEPRFFVDKAKGGGQRPTTIADARKNGWLPSVTTILDVLNKPGLNRWLIEQSVLAVSTAPDVAGETIDAKIDRVLNVERQQDEESRRARDKGTEIHDAMDKYFQGKQAEIPSNLLAWIEPAAKHVLSLGKVLHTEKVLVGDGYAGRCDLILETAEGVEIMDFKTSKKLPKEPYKENLLQASAYAEAWAKSGNYKTAIYTSNLYISTVDFGKFVYLNHGESVWIDIYDDAFQHLFYVWRWMNNYES